MLTIAELKAAFHSASNEWGVLSKAEFELAVTRAIRAAIDACKAKTITINKKLLLLRKQCPTMWSNAVNLQDEV